MAKQIRSIVRLDDVKSVYTGKNFSVRLPKEVENGHVIKLGDIEANNRDVHAGVAPIAEDKVVLIAEVPIVYDNNTLGSGQEKYFYMEKDEVVRAYELQENDIFSVTKEGIEGDAVVGEYLVSGAGTKLVPSATVPAKGFAAKVVREEPVGGKFSLNVTQKPSEYVVVEVVQNTK